LKAKWLILDLAEMKSAGGATFTKQDDGSVLASGTNPDFDTYTFVANTDLTGITAIRLEALAHPSMVKGGPGRAENGNIDLTDVHVTVAPRNPKPETRNPNLDNQGANNQAKTDAKPRPVKLVNAIATYEQGPHLAVKLAIDGDKKSGWALDPKFGQDHAAVFEPEAPFGADGGSVLTFTLSFNGNQRHNIGRPRLSVTTAAGPISLDGDALPAGVAELLATAADKRSAEQTKTLLNWFKYLDPDWKKLNQAVQESLAMAPQPKLAKVMVCSEGVKPIRHHTQGADFFNESHFLYRGDTNQKVEVASQGFLQVLMRSPEREKTWIEVPPAGATTSYRRRSLANWITDTEHGPGHLLARVLVNRLWQHHFHVGLVATPNDFGAMGQRPTHPELLDWLAATLIAPPGKAEISNLKSEIPNPQSGAGWRLKAMHKLILLSAVYQQSTTFDAAKSKLDPQNQFHWRRSPRRLEAEVIRDAMLAVSGSLDPTMFGPGTLDEGH
ncbi:MAG TPA: DUF1553 domain-containing protein, partial [Planctomycetaceae bacterium]|nr:DUF1553 domain-containing protein [Planctomycetaceae bacterium]